MEFLSIGEMNDKHIYWVLLSTLEKNKRETESRCHRVGRARVFMLRGWEDLSDKVALITDLKEVKTYKFKHNENAPNKTYWNFKNKY